MRPAIFPHSEVAKRRKAGGEAAKSMGGGKDASKLAEALELAKKLAANGVSENIHWKKWMSSGIMSSDARTDSPKDLNHATRT
jgi:hypothetical protein